MGSARGYILRFISDVEILRHILIISILEGGVQLRQTSRTIIQEELNNWPSITPKLRLSKAGDSVPPDKSGLHTKTPQHPNKKLP